VAGDLDEHFRKLMHDRVDLDGSAMILDNAEADAESETGSLSGGFGGEKGVKDAVKDPLGNTGALVFDADLHPRLPLITEYGLAGDGDFFVL
jgi:hypothetical protein